MFRKLLSRRNLLSHGLCLFTAVAMACVLSSKGVLAATPMGDEDDNAAHNGEIASEAGNGILHVAIYGIFF